MTVRRTVLDTNVLISALAFQAGTLSWIRGAWQSREILPLVSRATTQELIRVLSYPRFRLSVEDCENLLADYLPWCETIAMPDAPIEIPRCRDPHDRAFLELALAGRADSLVSGDSDLLALAGHFSIPVLTPAAFKEELVGLT